MSYAHFTRYEREFIEENLKLFFYVQLHFEVWGNEMSIK